MPAAFLMISRLCGSTSGQKQFRWVPVHDVWGLCLVDLVEMWLEPRLRVLARRAFLLYDAGDAAPAQSDAPARMRRLYLPGVAELHCLTLELLAEVPEGCCKFAISDPFSQETFPVYSIWDRADSRKRRNTMDRGKDLCGIRIRGNRLREARRDAGSQEAPLRRARARGYGVTRLPLAPKAIADAFFFHEIQIQYRSCRSGREKDARELGTCGKADAA